MYKQVEKPKENKSRAVANSVTQKNGGGNIGVGFVDNRPPSVAQRKMVNKSNDNVVNNKIIHYKSFPSKDLVSNIAQRKIQIKEVGDDKKTILYEEGNVKEILSKFDKAMGKYGSRIKDMLAEEKMHEFETFDELKKFLTTPAVNAFSRYVSHKIDIPKFNSNSITLYRAMSKDEAGALNSKDKFTMQIGKDYKESGLKFFATNIDYSIGLANTKNKEAIEKFKPELPYTNMVGAVVDKEEVAFGLQEDIGVHADSGHTKEFLSTREESVESGQSENAFRDVSSREKFPQDEQGRGYVLKHESGGLNFGVKPKTDQNTMSDWHSPIEYFNFLVKWRQFIGHFEAGQST